MTHVYVSLEKDEDGYPPYEMEELDALESGGGDRFRIEGIPVFVYGVSRGDIVRVVRVEGDSRLWVAEVLEHSNHWTARVLPKAPFLAHEVVAEFKALGCRAHSTPFGLVAIDVPPQVAAGDALGRLEGGKRAGSWDFDLGVSPN